MAVKYDHMTHYMQFKERMFLAKMAIKAKILLPIDSHYKIRDMLTLGEINKLNESPCAFYVFLPKYQDLFIFVLCILPRTFFT